MDAKAREELVEMVANNIFASGFTQNMANARGVARAAIAVVAPLIRADEREECAKVADQWIPAGHLRVDTARQIAEAIRAIRGGSNDG